MNHNFEISEFTLPAGAAPLACVDIGGMRIAVSVVDVLTEAGASVDLEGLAARFSGRGRWRERLPTILDTLVALGRARTQGDGRWVDAGR